MESHANPEHGPSSPVMAQVAPGSSTPPPRRKSRGFGMFFFMVLLMGLLGSLLVNFVLFSIVGFESLDSEHRVREEYFSHNRRGTQKVAIISVEGAILDGQGFVKRQIDHAGKDDDVKAVVLRVDSPGGTITGSDYIYHHLRELAKESKIPIVVSMGGIAASGGYYVSMAVGDTEDSIFAEPTTWTGSIGVVIPHYDLSGMLKEWGVKEDSIASHRLKTMGSFAKPMTEEERTIFQELVDDGFDRFKEIICQGRPKFEKNPEALDKLATGQIYTAEQALEAGLIDRIGFIEDAVERAIELANLDKDDVKVVKYRREPTLGDLLLGGQSRARTPDLGRLLDLAAPRAYYLYTWLPALASSRE